MTDSQMIALFWERNEDAIRETDAVYGRRLYLLADQILHSAQDAEESVNDTYLKAWETIPPQRPNYFFAYLAKICRNSALGRLQGLNAAKRSAEIVELTREMELCIPDDRTHLQMDGEELAEIMNRFLEGLPKDSRLIFLLFLWL